MQTVVCTLTPLHSQALCRCCSAFASPQTVCKRMRRRPRLRAERGARNEPVKREKKEETEQRAHKSNTACVLQCDACFALRREESERTSKERLTLLTPGHWPQASRIENGRPAITMQRSSKATAHDLLWLSLLRINHSRSTAAERSFFSTRQLSTHILSDATI